MRCRRAVLLAFVAVASIAPRPGQQITSSTLFGSVEWLSSEVPIQVSNSRSEPDEDRRQTVEQFRKLSPAFVPNVGQASPAVRYVAQGPGYAFFFTSDEMVLLFDQHRPQTQSNPTDRQVVRPASSEEPRAQGIVLGLRFLGANAEVGMEGTKPAPGRANYFIGNDSATWRSGLTTYGGVTYRSLWPGIDMVVRGEDGSLKSEFLVQPGARLEDIRLSYAGTDSLLVDAVGDLVLHTSFGILRDSRPIAYQLIGQRRVPVEARYVLSTNPGEVVHGFEIATGYDPAYPLVIDPGLTYSTFLGGSAVDGSLDIALDVDGNAYVMGLTFSRNFPTTRGAYDRMRDGRFDVFVTKVDATGSNLAYSTYLGGTGDEPEFLSGEIAVDSQGQAYVSGLTRSSDFPTTSGAYDRSFNGGFGDVFVTKLDAQGSALVYSSYLGGLDLETVDGLVVDKTGAAYLTGTTSSTDFPTTRGSFDPTHNGNDDAFVTKLNPPGSGLAYSTFLGAGDFDLGQDVAVAGTGQAYVTGVTYSPDFPTTAGAYDRTFNGVFADAFVAELNRTGSGLIFSTFLGGPDTFNGGFDIVVDPVGHPYVTGTTGSLTFPTTPGAFDRTFNGGFTDIFVTEFNTTGSNLIFSTYLGGDDFESPDGIAVDPAGGVYVFGGTSSLDFPTTPGALQQTSQGNSEMFLSKLDTQGAALVYSTYLGTVDEDFGAGLATDPAGNAYLTGQTDGPDFPTTPDAFDPSFNGVVDAFVTKLDLSCGGHPVTIFGTGQDDTIAGTPGVDVIAGQAGNDVLHGMAGDDALCGGPGDDLILGGSGDDKLSGESGNDQIGGEAGADLLSGSAGDDVLEGGDDNDSLRGGDGRDTLEGSDGFDLCDGGAGTDTVLGCERVNNRP